MAKIKPTFPTAQTSCLHRADGSASYIHYYSSSITTNLLVSVNGPMEIRARDEHYGRAVVEVIVRPSVGVPTYREKYLESRLASALSPVILSTLAPRTLIQIVLQIIQAPPASLTATSTTASGSSTGTGETYSPILLLPAAITTSILALLDAGVPLTSTLDAVFVTASKVERTRENSLMPDDGAKEEEEGEEEDSIITVNPYLELDSVKSARSKHVLVYSTAIPGPVVDSDGNVLEMGVEGGWETERKGQGELVFVESEGEFTWKEWEAVEAEARRTCMGFARDDGGDMGEDGDVKMEVDDDRRISESKTWGRGMMATLIRQVVGQKVVRDLRWRK